MGVEVIDAPMLTAFITACGGRLVLVDNRGLLIRPGGRPSRVYYNVGNAQQ